MSLSKRSSLQDEVNALLSGGPSQPRSTLDDEDDLDDTASFAFERRMEVDADDDTGLGPM